MSAVDIACSALAGLIAGILSAWGVGGGTLLVIYLTAAAGLPQQTAQGINLTYFIPASAGALWSHLKGRLVEASLAVPAAVCGALTAAAASLAAAAVGPEHLRKIFGAFIIAVGLSELFSRPKPSGKGARGKGLR